jgi:hypothetical protein
MKYLTASLCLFVLAGCGKLPSKPQKRAPTEPNFLVKGSYSGPSGTRTVWLDGKLGRARVDTDKKIFLINLDARSYKALSPNEKIYFSYDPKRQQKLQMDHLVAEASMYLEAGNESGGGAFIQQLKMLLAHPCERAKERLGAHTGCQHVDSGNGHEEWTHTSTTRGSMQDGFKKRSSSLTNSYEPRRGLILTENYQSTFGSGSSSFTPQEDAKPSETDLEVPAGYKEVLTDAELTAKALRPIGSRSMVGGSNWRMLQFYQRGYPAGAINKTVAVTEEVWTYTDTNTKNTNRSVSIWRMRAPNLLKPGELQKLNKEHRLSNRFNHPTAKSPGSEPFKVGKDGWTVVRSNSALSVRAALGFDEKSAHALLLSLASGDGEF